MKSPKKTVDVKKGSDNVFADVGLDRPEERLVKAQLADQIGRIIAARKLTQTKAAAVLGLDQPKVSALMRGRLKGFSVERLFRCLNDLGQEIEITIRPARQAGRRPDTHIVVPAG